MKAVNNNYSAILLACCLALPSMVFGQSAPESWPCVQVYVKQIDAAVYWNDRVQDNPEAMEPLAVTQAVNRLFKAGFDRAKIDALVSSAFAQIAPEHQRAARQMVFDGVFKKIRRKRERYLEGIIRQGNGQLKLAELLETEFNQLDALEANEISLSEEQEFDLRQRVTWNERLLLERNAQLNRLCDAPVELTEQLSAVTRRLNQED